MAIKSSGPLALYNDIGRFFGVSRSNVSLRAMSSRAGKGTPDAMSEFYGYGVPPPVAPPPVRPPVRPPTAPPRVPPPRRPPVFIPPPAAPPAPFPPFVPPPRRPPQPPPAPVFRGPRPILREWRIATKAEARQPAGRIYPGPSSAYTYLRADNFNSRSPGRVSRYTYNYNISGGYNTGSTSRILTSSRGNNAIGETIFVMSWLNGTNSRSGFIIQNLESLRYNPFSSIENFSGVRWVQPFPGGVN